MSVVEDLGRQLEAAYAAVEELDEDLRAGRISAADHADLRTRSERQAAAVLKRLQEAERGERRAPAREAATRPSMGSRLRSPVSLMLGAVLLLVAGVGLGVFLGRSTGEAPARPEAGAPGGAGGRPPVSAELEALRPQVEPENAPTDVLLAFAHRALDEGQIPAAIWAYKRVLARDGRNVEAITHMGVILSRGGHWDRALARLDEALAIDPGYAHAHWDRAQVLMNGTKDYAGAAAAFEAFLKAVPDGEDAERARQMLAEARRLAAAPPATAGPAGMPSAPAGPRGKSPAAGSAAPPRPGPGSSAAPPATVPVAARPPLSPGLALGSGASTGTAVARVAEIRWRGEPAPGGRG